MMTSVAKNGRDSGLNGTCLLANPFCRVLSLNNSYVGIRHGEAAISIGKVLCSEVERCPGLTARGAEQIAAVTFPLLLNALGNRPLVIVHSPLPRTEQTARILKEQLAVRGEIYSEAMPELRERGWGMLNGLPDSQWDNVRDRDLVNPAANLRGVEPMSVFAGRVCRALEILEQRFSGVQILIVSHADCLQVIEHLFQRSTAFKHYTDDTSMFQLGEVRPLLLSPIGDFRDVQPVRK